VGVNCVIKFAKGTDSITLHAVAWNKDGWDISHIAQDNQNVYSGPKVADLEDELVDGFYNFMEERGLDASLSSYIAMHCYGAENKLYTGWLKGIKAYVDKK
jgi:hypothetical protein